MPYPNSEIGRLKGLRDFIGMNRLRWRSSIYVGSPYRAPTAMEDSCGIPDARPPTVDSRHVADYITQGHLLQGPELASSGLGPGNLQIWNG